MKRSINFFNQRNNLLKRRKNFLNQSNNLLERRKDLRKLRNKNLLLRFKNLLRSLFYAVFWICFFFSIKKPSISKY